MFKTLIINCTSDYTNPVNNQGFNFDVFDERCKLEIV